jgi:hypothetical protein
VPTALVAATVKNHGSPGARPDTSTDVAGAATSTRTNADPGLNATTVYCNTGGVHVMRELGCEVEASPPGGDHATCTPSAVTNTPPTLVGAEGRGAARVNTAVVFTVAGPVGLHAVRVAR